MPIVIELNFEDKYLFCDSFKHILFRKDTSHRGSAGRFWDDDKEPRRKTKPLDMGTNRNRSKRKKNVFKNNDQAYGRLGAWAMSRDLEGAWGQRGDSKLSTFHGRSPRTNIRQQATVEAICIMS
jgi:hypothetical protein